MCLTVSVGVGQFVQLSNEGYLSIHLHNNDLCVMFGWRILIRASAVFVLLFLNDANVQYPKSDI